MRHIPLLKEFQLSDLWGKKGLFTEARPEIIRNQYLVVDWLKHPAAPHAVATALPHFAAAVTTLLDSSVADHELSCVTIEVK